MPNLLYLYIITVLLVTNSLCGFVSNQVQYNMESVQYQFTQHFINLLLYLSLILIPKYNTNIVQYGTRTVYPTERKKGQGLTLQTPDEDRCIQRPKRCDKYGDKDEDNSPKKNVNNVHNTSSQKYRKNQGVNKRKCLEAVSKNKCFTTGN